MTLTREALEAGLRILIVGPTSKRYHRAPHGRGRDLGDDLILTTIEEAQALGFTPCRTCEAGNPDWPRPTATALENALEFQERVRSWA